MESSKSPLLSRVLAILVLVVLTRFPKAEGWLKRRLGVKPASEKSLLLPPDTPLKPPTAGRSSNPNIGE